MTRTGNALVVDYLFQSFICVSHGRQTALSQMSAQAGGASLSIYADRTASDMDFGELDTLLSDASEQTASFTMKLSRAQAIISSLCDELRRKRALLKMEVLAHDETRKQLRNVQHEFEKLQKLHVNPVQMSSESTEIDAHTSGNAQRKTILKLQASNAVMRSRLARSESALKRAHRTARRAKLQLRYAAGSEALSKERESELKTARKDLDHAQMKLDEKSGQISFLTKMAVQARMLQIQERKELCRMISNYMQQAESSNKSLRQMELKLESLKKSQMGSQLTSKLRQQQWFDSGIEFESITPTKVSIAKV